MRTIIRAREQPFALRRRERHLRESIADAPGAIACRARPRRRPRSGGATIQPMWSPAARTPSTGRRDDPPRRTCSPTPWPAVGEALGTPDDPPSITHAPTPRRSPHRVERGVAEPRACRVVWIVQTDGARLMTSARSSSRSHVYPVRSVYCGRVSYYAPGLHCGAMPARGRHLHVVRGHDDDPVARLDEPHQHAVGLDPPLVTCT